MATTKTKATGARKGAGLPPITVAKLEETGKLIERVIRENQTIFVQRGHEYRETHREASGRPLKAAEAVALARELAEEDRVQVAAELQGSELRVHEDPEQREVLLAGGAAAAPAFIAVVRDVVALVEMPAEEFEAVCEADTLPEAIEERSKDLRKLELSEARKRASAAFAHYARAAGFEPGEAWRLPVQAVWQALSDAATQLAGSASPSSIASAASTTGADETSSTGSAGQTP